MSEIEFRVWNTESKEFTYFDTPYFTLLKSPIVAFENCRCDKVMLIGYTDPMQYIGLKDKNGKKIFVGDYVNFGCNDYPDIRLIEDLKTAHYWMCKCVLTEYCNVLGNKYEQPDLLNKLNEGV
jgi:hypothetical protein